MYKSFDVSSVFRIYVKVEGGYMNGLYKAVSDLLTQAVACRPWGPPPPTAPRPARRPDEERIFKMDTDGKYAFEKIFHLTQPLEQLKS